MDSSKEYEIITLTYFRKWHETAKKNELNFEQYGKLIHAMCEYCFNDIDTDLKGCEGVIFDMAKSSIDASNRKKKEGSEGGQKSKGKSGAPVGNTNAIGKKKP